MPSAPLLRQVNALILEKGGFGPIYERVAAGEKLIDIAKDYTPAGRATPLSRPWFYWVITRKPELKTAYQAAMALKAHILAEEALEIVDGAPETREGIQKASKQADLRLWLAARLNRPDFGDRAPGEGGTNVHIHAGSLHIDALRASPASTPKELSSGTAALPVIDAHIEPEESHDGREDHGPRVASGS